MRRLNWEAIGAIAGVVGVVVAIFALRRPDEAPVPTTLPTIVSVTVTAPPTVVPASIDTPQSVATPLDTVASSPTPTAVSVAPDPVILTGDIVTVTSPIQMELVRVPAGDFLMGNTNEPPQHRVDLTEFYIGKYEVTNAQYAVFLIASGRKAPAKWENGTIPDGKKDHPVVYVSWYDAVAFTEWLSSQTSMAFRLPTEAEWEKACRGTDGQLYPWGDTAPIMEQANINWYVGSTTKVGAYSPQGDSPYGLADMVGNVREWTSSQYRDYPYEANDGREDLTDYVRRVVRGRGFTAEPSYVRCTVRSSTDPYERFWVGGFRIGLTPLSASGL